LTEREHGTGESSNPEPMLPVDSGTPEQVAPETESSAGVDSPVEPERTSRDVLYEAIGVELVSAGVFTPAREFVDQVRKAVGTRVSPRDVSAIVTQIALSGAEVSADAVANIARSSTGGRSQRQQRNADQWRALGAALTLREMDGSPEGQRTFIGEARRVAGKHATDGLVLQIALALADIGAQFDAETVGKLGKRLALSAPDIPPESMNDIVHSELRTLNRVERAEAISKRKNRSSSGARRTPSGYPHNPGARKLRPGRRNIRSLPEKEGRGEAQ
jgi:hypothetical protein